MAQLDKFYDIAGIVKLVVDYAATPDVGQLFAKLDKYAYQGFDPKASFDSLLEKAVALGITKASFLDHVFELVMIGVFRGTAIHKPDFISRCTEDLKARIEFFVRNYDLQGNLAKSKGPKVITIARVMAVFPEYVALMLCTGKARTIATNPNLPVYFSFPGSPSIMSDAAWNRYQAAYFDFMIGFTRVVRPNSADSDDIIKQKQGTIATAQRTSNFNVVKRKSVKAMVTAYKNTIPEAVTKEVVEKKLIMDTIDALIQDIGA